MDSHENAGPAQRPDRPGGPAAVKPANPLAPFEAEGPLAGDLAQVEKVLSQQMESPVGPIPRVGEHLLGAGGKRLRPMLAVLAARASGAPVELGVAVGVAAELIHSATLFHDDVVDDGRVRRGRPAARMVFGNGIVVLVGDFCLARALETVAATGVIEVVRSLAATVTEMAEGEVAQLEGAGNPEASTEDYFRVIDRKTASLIAWCATVGRSSGPHRDALEQYGRAIGRAFQIADDILDCAVAEGVAGKSVGHDLREGKLTLPVLLACDADAALRGRIRAAMTDTGVAADAVPGLLAAVGAAGGVTAARAQAQNILHAGLDALLGLPASPERDALWTLGQRSVDRVS